MGSRVCKNAAELAKRHPSATAIGVGECARLIPLVLVSTWTLPTCAWVERILGIAAWLPGSVWQSVRGVGNAVSTADRRPRECRNQKDPQRVFRPRVQRRLLSWSWGALTPSNCGHARPGQELDLGARKIRSGCCRRGLDRLRTRVADGLGRAQPRSRARSSSPSQSGVGSCPGFARGDLTGLHPRLEEVAASHRRVSFLALASRSSEHRPVNRRRTPPRSGNVHRPWSTFRPTRSCSRRSAICE